MWKPRQNKWACGSWAEKNGPEIIFFFCCKNPAWSYKTIRSCKHSAGYLKYSVVLGVNIVQSGTLRLNSRSPIIAYFHIIKPSFHQAENKSSLSLENSDCSQRSHFSRSIWTSNEFQFQSGWLLNWAWSDGPILPRNQDTIRTDKQDAPNILVPQLKYKNPIRAPSSEG